MKTLLLFAVLSGVCSVPIMLNSTKEFENYVKMLQGIGPVVPPADFLNRTPKKPTPAAPQHLLGEDVQHDYAAIQFSEFRARFNKKYISTEEEKKRFLIFQSNMHRVARAQVNERGSAKYSVMTPFGDMAEEEFDKYYKMPTHFFENAPELPQADIPSIYRAPAQFDWREKGAVTKVKNQGQCGSCWAFSTTGNIEGQWFIKKKHLVSLSEQELVDCDKVDQGCEGGLPSNAYKQIIKLGGLETEAKYPYDAADDHCQYQKKLSAVYINSSVAISQDEKAMAAWLAQNGPISIGINANVMQFYTGGVSHPWSFFCGKSNLDHGVLIVGYGTEGSEPYWIIKNSWGDSWGEKGYYRVYRGDGTCGLNRMCTSAVIH